MSSYRIPFNRPILCGNELRYLKEVTTSSRWSGDGPFTAKCAAMLKDALQTSACLLTTSCTDALEMSALLLELSPGDEVIVPSFTFVSSVNAFVLRGARPVFADIRADTLNIDETKLESLITEKTRAIVVVHYAGVGCEMDNILDIARRHSIAVIEDNAHGLFGRYRDRPLGSMGRLATQSFHETKNFTCGEGGALAINDPTLIDRAEILREKGTNRSRFFRGQVDKYSWVDVGSSFLPSELNAAVLWAQLERHKWIQERRRDIWTRYQRGLNDWAREQNVLLPFVPGHCDQAYHMYYMILPSLDARTRLIDRLKSEGILAVFHYVPLHLSDMGRRLGSGVGDCPVTENLSDRLLRLPFFNGLDPSEQDQVIEVVRGFKPE